MTERERWWATATVWMEARGEPFLGQLAVAYVIQNRVHDARYPGTVGEVVLQPRQFSAWDHESPTRRQLALVEEASPGWAQALRAVLTAELGAEPDVTLGARHYYNPAAAAPAWDRDRRLARVEIGRHVFVRGVP